MQMKYKLIIGPDPYTLEARVNKFLEDCFEYVEFIGPVQVLGHEMYCQTFQVEGFAK